jgi:O-methyltransferase
MRDLHFSELRWPGRERREEGALLRSVNRLLRKLRSPVVLARRFDHAREMVSHEQAANLQHLLHRAMRKVPHGAVVELGGYVGCTASVIAKVLDAAGWKDRFHVYDRFDVNLGGVTHIRGTFERNLRAAGLPLPHIHQGDVLELLPAELPERIAFAHVDLGVGANGELLHRTMTHALAALYPRLAPGAVTVVMDYHVPGVTLAGHDSNPAVRDACDAFLAQKPERMVTLYGGPCSHGFFEKS